MIHFVESPHRKIKNNPVGMVHFVESPHRKIKNNPVGMIHFVESPHRKIKNNPVGMIHFVGSAHTEKSKTIPTGMMRRPQPVSRRTSFFDFFIFSFLQKHLYKTTRPQFHPQSGLQ